MTPRRRHRTKRWPGVVLGPMIAFLEERYPDGLCVEDIANTIGTTKQYISFTFNKDDMKLSGAERIARCYGYELRLYFEEKRYLEGLSAPPRTKEYPNAGNLKGLVDYTLDSNWTINRLAVMTGFSYCCIEHGFKTGDMMLSVLQELTSKIGIQYIWKFEKIKTDKQ